MLRLNEGRTGFLRDVAEEGIALKAYGKGLMRLVVALCYRGS